MKIIKTCQHFSILFSSLSVIDFARKINKDEKPSKQRENEQD